MPKMRVPLRETQSRTPPAPQSLSKGPGPSLPSLTLGGLPGGERWPLGFGGIEHSVDLRVTGKLAPEGLLDNILGDPNPVDPIGHNTSALFIEFIKGLKKQDPHQFDPCYYTGPQVNTTDYDHVVVTASFLIYKSPDSYVDRGPPLERNWVTEYVTNSRIDKAVSSRTSAGRRSGPSRAAPLCKQCDQTAFMNDLRTQVFGVFGLDAPCPGPCCRSAKPKPPKKPAGVSKRTKKPKSSDAVKRNAKPKPRQTSKSGSGVNADETVGDYLGSWENDPDVFAGLVDQPPAGDDYPPLGDDPMGLGSQTMVDELFESAVVDGGAGAGSGEDNGVFVFEDEWQD